jgi:hypothetical protein
MCVSYGTTACTGKGDDDDDDDDEDDDDDALNVSGG